MSTKITDHTAQECTDQPDTQVCPKGENVCPIFSEVENLRQEVRTDPLTGLFNRRQLLYTLDQEMERTRRSLEPTSLIMLDIDGFKEVNDAHGHLIGDRILEKLAQQVIATIRKLDIACRYGGEEFAIVLPSTHLLTGVRVAERLRNNVASTPIDIQGVQHTITISLGVDTYTHQHAANADDFIDRADKKLYEAKQAGRNCVRHGSHMTANTTRVAQDEKRALDALFENNHPE